MMRPPAAADDGLQPAERQAEFVAALEPLRPKVRGVLDSHRSAVRREILQNYKFDFDQYKR